VPPYDDYFDGGGFQQNGNHALAIFPFSDFPKRLSATTWMIEEHPFKNGLPDRQAEELDAVERFLILAAINLLRFCHSSPPAL
jgi:hypothetical protein